MIPRILFILILSAGIITGCRKNDDWPVEPEIEYVDFLQTGGDSAWLVFNFRDGDGDLGFPEDDTANTSIFLTYMEVTGGVATEIPLPLPFTYKMPDITPEGKNKAIEGEVRVLLTFYYDAGSDFDAIRYRFYLVDRAGNKSNELETPDIYIEP